MAFSKPTGFKAWLTGYKGGTVPVVSPRRFDVANIIASGTFGTVLRISDTRSGECFALKAPKQAGDEYTRAMLQHEARVHADIAPHATITPLVAAVAAGMGPLSGLLLPIAPEATLEKWLTDGPHGAPLGYARTLAAADGVLAGLEHVHAAGYAHLDVKPANTLRFDVDLAAPGALKLADFGLAQHLGAHLDTGGYGTPGYLPPELATPGVHVVSAAMDVHAFGVVLLELAAQRSVYLGLDSQRYAALTRSGGLLAAYLGKLGDMRGGVPASLLAVVEACMAPDPAARPTVGQLRQHLAELAAWHARMPEVPRGAAAAPPPPAAAPAATSAWAQLPADYAAALRVGKRKPLVAPAGTASGCKSPAIGARRGGGTPTAAPSHCQPSQPLSPSPIAVQRLRLPSTLGVSCAFARCITASAADGTAPLTRGGGTAGSLANAPVPGSASSTDSDTVEGPAVQRLKLPSTLGLGCSCACSITARVASDTAPVARSGGAASGPSSTAVAAGPCSANTAEDVTATVCDGGAMAGTLNLAGKDAAAPDPPAAAASTDSSPHAAVIKTHIPGNSELRRLRSRAIGARRGERLNASEVCGAAAVSSGLTANEAEVSGDEDALSDREAAACVWEDEYFARAARCRSAKRRPARGARAGGKRRRR